MYRIAICDDEQAFCSHLQNLLQQILSEEELEYEADCYSDASDLLRAVREGGREYNLIFLDILLGNANGVDAARELRRCGVDADIVFITCTPSYALSSFEVAPLHYLIKPADKRSLRTALHRSLERFRCAPALVVNCGGNKRRIVQTGDILYMEVFHTELVVHCRNNATVTGTGSLSKISEELPAPNFIRCHRSFIVNLDHVEGIQKYQFTLNNKEQIPIAKHQYVNVFSQMMNYLV